MPPSRGRPDLGKTKTIKQRAVYIYLPTEEMLEEWKQAARRFDMSLSRFLVEVVDDVLRKNPQGISPRAEVEARLAQINVELTAFRHENEALRFLLQRAEEELADYRTALSTASQPSQDDDTLRRLIRLFHGRLVWKLQDFPEAMGINTGDQEGMRRLKVALDRLRELGMIEGDFEEVRCKIGGRTQQRKPAKPKAKRKHIKDGKGHPGIHRRLRTEKDDAEYGHIVRVESP